MNLNFDPDVILKWGSPPFRELKNIDEIVVHHTAGDGNWNGLKSWILGNNNEREKNHSRFIGLTHYYIDKSGDITQIYKNDAWSYHSCSGTHDKKTIGIELVHSTGKFTDKQYGALVELISSICQICTIKQIVSHDYNYMTFSKNTKGCPGKFFDWSRLKIELQKNKLDIAIKTLDIELRK